MADILDLVNAVRIGNLEDARAAGSKRVDLRERVESMREQYGVNIPNLYQFNQENPPRQPDGLFKRVIKNAFWGVVIGGLVGAAVLGATALLTSGAMTLSILGTTGLSAIGVAAAAGAAVFSFASIFEDQRPAIEQEQTIKYENYLNNLESELRISAPARQQTQQPGAADASASRHFQDMVTASRNPAEQQRG
ncbi:MAG: hypothetical protein K2Q12_09890 [Rickettsiales bacterium]|nr:hypothetical protein [Rickettsiales bacterium]